MEWTSFIDWLDRELAERGWNDYQLAHRAGLSHSVISKARRGHTPRWEACAAIAGALRLPAELVFRRAGLLPPLPEDESALAELRALIPQLTPRDRQELVQIARLKLRLAEARRRHQEKSEQTSDGA
jgi:transcriptional regulator with XRE-family HTH domain